MRPYVVVGLALSTPACILGHSRSQHTRGEKLDLAPAKASPQASPAYVVFDTRYAFSLEPQPAPDSYKAFSIPPGVGEVVAAGAKIAYEAVLRAIEREQKRYDASYTARVSGHDFYEVRDATKAAQSTGTPVPRPALEAFAGQPPFAVPPAPLAKALGTLGVQRLGEQDYATLRELVAAKLAADDAASWLLGVRAISVGHLRGFTLLRFARHFEDDGEGTSSTSTLQFKIEATADGTGHIALTHVALHHTAAKVPSDPAWNLLSWVDDEVQDKVDVVVIVRLEHTYVDDKGVAHREVLLDEPLTTFRGIDLSGDKDASKPLFERGSATSTIPIARSSPFSLPRLRIAHVDVARKAVYGGSYALAVTVKESNKLGDYLRRALDAAEEHRDDVLESIEKNLERLVEATATE